MQSAEALDNGPGAPGRATLYSYAIVHQLYHPAFAAELHRGLFRESSAGEDLEAEPPARAVTTAMAPAAASQGDVHVQFRAWDMLSGALEPELGGHPRYLDVVGINCYASRQTESETLAPLPGRRGARRRMPLHRVLAAVHQRYARPMMIGERSPIGVSRGVSRPSVSSWRISPPMS